MFGSWRKTWKRWMKEQKEFEARNKKEVAKVENKYKKLSKKKIKGFEGGVIPAKYAWEKDRAENNPFRVAKRDLKIWEGFILVLFIYWIFSGSFSYESFIISLSFLIMATLFGISTSFLGVFYFSLFRHGRKKQYPKFYSELSTICWRLLALFIILFILVLMNM